MTVIEWLATLGRHGRRFAELRREFARSAVAIARRYADDPPAIAYVKRQRDLETLLDEYYGRYPGDPEARFARFIDQEVRVAAGLAIDEASTV